MRSHTARMDLLRSLLEAEAAAGRRELEAEHLEETGNALRAALLRHEAAQLRQGSRVVARRLKQQSLPDTA